MKTKHILIALAAIIIASSAALNVVISNRSSEKAISNMSVADLEALSQGEIDSDEYEPIMLSFYGVTYIGGSGNAKYPKVDHCIISDYHYEWYNGFAILRVLIYAGVYLDCSGGVGTCSSNSGCIKTQLLETRTEKVF